MTLSSSLSEYNLDCRYFLGDRPCGHWIKPVCTGCPHASPMGRRILLIKFGALGDVVRTTGLPNALRQAWGEPLHLTWLTSQKSVPIVQRAFGVDRTLGFDAATLAIISAEKFDDVICLDKDALPCALAVSKPEAQLWGFGLTTYGTMMPLNLQSLPLFKLGLDNEEKFYRNSKSMPQLIHEAIGLEYQGERYQLNLFPQDRLEADAYFKSVPQQAVIIGINPGAGGVFANKAWPIDRYIKLIQQLLEQQSELFIMLLGGSSEADLLAQIKKSLENPKVILPNKHLPLEVSAALIERCSVLVSGDTLAMHLALALGRRVVTLFGPTCHQEIDLFGLGEKIISSISCAPCYKRQCHLHPNCQEGITVTEVFEAVLRQLSQMKASTVIPASPT